MFVLVEKNCFFNPIMHLIYANSSHLYSCLKNSHSDGAERLKNLKIPINTGFFTSFRMTYLELYNLPVIPKSKELLFSKLYYQLYNTILVISLF